MPWITPKLDWLPSDFINSADFNRIENNTQEVVAYLNGIQYEIPSISLNTTRTTSSIDFLSSINRIEQNLEVIRSSFLTPAGYLDAKTWTAGKGFNFMDAIRLESNIQLLMDYGLLVFKSFRICGAYTCGDQWGLY